MRPKLTTANDFLCSSALLLLHLIQFGGWAFSIYLTLRIYFSAYAWLLLPYLYWIFVRDADRFDRVPRPWRYLVDSKFARYIRDYYPVELIKSEDYELDPRKNYYFNLVPHGLLGIQSYIVFGNIFQTTKSAFPHHESHSCALSIFGKIPFYRELLFVLGTSSSSKEAITHVLTRPGGGHLLAIMPGGAAETYHSWPNTYKTIVKRRKGFARISLTTGAPLVPVVCFNIVDDFDYQLRHPLLDVFQRTFKSVTRVMPAIGHGRFGLSFFPKRVPMTFIACKPIDVEKVENPSQEQIDELHAKFVDRLVEAFELHKHKYVDDPEKTFLEFVD